MLIIRNESSDEEVVPDTPPVSTPVIVSVPPVSNIQVSQISSQPLEIVTTKSVSEEVPIFDTVVNVSDTGAPITSVDTTMPISLPITFPISTIIVIYTHLIFDI